jgi:hypothetical protein
MCPVSGPHCGNLPLHVGLSNLLRVISTPADRGDSFARQTPAFASIHQLGSGRRGRLGKTRACLAPTVEPVEVQSQHRLGVWTRPSGLSMQRVANFLRQSKRLATAPADVSTGQVFIFRIIFERSWHVFRLRKTLRNSPRRCRVRTNESSGCIGNRGICVFPVI